MPRDLVRNLLSATILHFFAIRPYQRVPEAIQDRGGESRERGMQGAGGESRAGGANHAKKGILPCYVIIIFC